MRKLLGAGTCMVFAAACAQVLGVDGDGYRGREAAGGSGGVDASVDNAGRSGANSSADASDDRTGVGGTAGADASDGRTAVGGASGASVSDGSSGTGGSAGVDGSAGAGGGPTPDASDGKSVDSGTVDSPGYTDAVTDLPVDTKDGSTDIVSEDSGPCGAHCASGVCGTNGDCQPCVKDNECTGGRICNAGTCGATCGDGGVTCAGSLVCCVDHCVDITRDPQHCGACGTSCPSAQFCGNASTPACKNNVLSNVCNTKAATFLLDGLADDDAASGTVKSAVATHCSPSPTLLSVAQTSSTAINTTTGEPVIGGGDLLVATGPDSNQLVVRYLEASRISPVYNESDGITALTFKRRGGAADGGDSIVITIGLTTITPTHDYFLVEVVKDQLSGTFTLVIYGIESPGTKAAAYYFAAVMLPNIGSYPQAWYVYEWIAAAGGTTPGVNDTFNLINSGM